MKIQGNIGSLLPVAASVASSLLRPSSGNSGQPIPAGGNTTISPSFQQAFTPQFSPTMQQQQDSPGATQTAVPTQYAAAGQTALTGEGMPPIPIPSPTMPFLPDTSRYTPTFQTQTPGQYQQLITIGILAAAAIMIANMYKGKRVPAKTTTGKSAIKRKAKSK